ncbi:MAG: hypothetical protein OXU81_19010 [Gammaproteobacteria bacterium]|nr:hypothetical protein [Gammaproteobacteria bacterium]
MLRDFAEKLHAMQRSASLSRIESELEVLVQTEGLATRSGPKKLLDPGMRTLLREALTTARVVEFRWLAQRDRFRTPVSG